MFADRHLVIEDSSSKSKKVNPQPQPKQTVPPLFVDSETRSRAEKAINKQTQNRTSPSEESVKGGDYSYIDRNSAKVPILHLHGNQYRNMYTREEVDGEEARQILEYCGYAPKKMISLPIFFAICLFLALPLKILGPVGLMIWGYNTINKKNVTLQKEQAGMIFRSQVPLSSEERSEYSKRGVLYIATGIIIGLLQLMFGLI